MCLENYVVLIAVLMQNVYPLNVVNNYFNVTLNNIRTNNQLWCRKHD